MIREIIKNITPYGIVKWHRHLCCNHFRKEREILLKRGDYIREYFLSLNKNTQDAETVQIIEYFESHKFSHIPYIFTRNYQPSDIQVFYDNSCRMRYVLHNGKRMYFPLYFEDDYSVACHYTGLCTEQDADSPHRYETANFTPKKGDIIVDVGATEGIWGLTYAEQAKHIYLFECQREWAKALIKTFEPWREKVSVMTKYVSDVTQGHNITLDDFFFGGHDGGGGKFYKS